MKTLIAISVLVFSVHAMAQKNYYTADAKILPAAKVITVSCSEPSHAGHDWSTAGHIEVLSSNGQTINMAMAVSRFADDEKKEAAKLCKAMKAIKASGKNTDLIFTEEQDFNDDDQPRLDVKGGANLNGLDELQNY